MEFYGSMKLFVLVHLTRRVRTKKIVGSVKKGKKVSQIIGLVFFRWLIRREKKETTCVMESRYGDDDDGVPSTSGISGRPRVSSFSFSSG